MVYRQSIERCLSNPPGSPHGVPGAITTAELAAVAEELAPAFARVQADIRTGRTELYAITAESADLAAAEPFALRFRASFRDVVVLGTGGSSLGGRTLVALADRGFGPLPGAPRVHFAENVDPHTLTEMLARLDLTTTGFVAISKSGGTPETMAQMMVVLAALPDRHRIAEQVLVITEPTGNALGLLAKRHGISALPHPVDIGGRYSALSLVGLLPARIAGLDPGAARRGAAHVLTETVAATRVADSAPATGAALAVALLRRRKLSQTVLLPYIDRLATFSLWWRQLWAESLGKNGGGTTPIPALGTVDQHSQLQLYLDGPRDKLFTVITTPTRGTGPRVDPALCGDPSLNWLAGRTIGDLIHCEARATVDSLAAHGRPVRELMVDRVDEATVGALMMHFVLETILTADLLGISPFGQPAVEDGKRRTREMMATIGP